MLTGIINRRLTGRTPLKADLKIKFINPDGESVLLATATNISAGGMRFTVEESANTFSIGEKIEFHFQLPNSNTIEVLSEVRHSEADPESDPPEVHYGVKFLDLALDDLNAIIDYANANPATPFQTSYNSDTIQESEIPVSLLPATIRMEDGARLPAKVEDISFGGARINLDRLIPVNHRVSIDIAYNGEIVPLSGCCIWSAPDYKKPACYLAGIYFNQLTAEEFEHLKQLINK